MEWPLYDGMHRTQTFVPSAQWTNGSASQNLTSENLLFCLQCYSIPHILAVSCKCHSFFRLCVMSSLFNKKIKYYIKPINPLCIIQVYVVISSLARYVYWWLYHIISGSLVVLLHFLPHLSWLSSLQTITKNYLPASSRVRGHCGWLHLSPAHPFKNSSFNISQWNLPLDIIMIQIKSGDHNTTIVQPIFSMRMGRYIGILPAMYPSSNSAGYLSCSHGWCSVTLHQLREQLK